VVRFEVRHVSPYAYWIRNWADATNRPFVWQKKKKSAPCLESIPVSRSCSTLPIYYNVKIKCILVQAVRLCSGRMAYRGSRGIALLFLDHGTRRSEVSASRSGRSFPGKDPIRIVQEAGWTPRPVWTDAENFAPIGIRSPDRPARSQSLYRLCYTAHTIYYTY